MSELPVTGHQVSRRRTLSNFSVLQHILYVIDIMTLIIFGMFFAIFPARKILMKHNEFHSILFERFRHQLNSGGILYKIEVLQFTPQFKCCIHGRL